jgi:hypothetical protein
MLWRHKRLQSQIHLEWSCRIVREYVVTACIHMTYICLHCAIIDAHCYVTCVLFWCKYSTIMVSLHNLPGVIVVVIVW